MGPKFSASANHLPMTAAPTKPHSTQQALRPSSSGIEASPGGESDAGMQKVPSSGDESHPPWHSSPLPNGWVLAGQRTENPLQDPKNKKSVGVRQPQIHVRQPLFITNHLCPFASEFKDLLSAPASCTQGTNVNKNTHKL